MFTRRLIVEAWCSRNHGGRGFCTDLAIIARMLRSLFCLILFPVSIFAQTQEKVREYRRANEHQILNEFTALLADHYLR